MTITRDDLRKCTTRLVMHLNMGRNGHTLTRQCVEHPRLTISQFSRRKPREFKVTYFVDGEPFDTLDAALVRLNEPQRVSP